MKIKDFFKQIGIELRKMFRSKFMVIMLAILLVFSIASPFIAKAIQNQEPTYYNRYMDDEQLIINGITLNHESPMYWEIQELNHTKEMIERNAATIDADIALDYVDRMLEKLLLIAEHVTTHDDYRSDVTWQIRQNVAVMFILDHLDVPADEMRMLMEQSNIYVDKMDVLDTEYYQLSEIDRLAKYQEAEDQVTLIMSIVENHDHIQYLEYMIEQSHNSVEDMYKQIEQMEKDLVENPMNEEMYNEQIKNTQRRIKSMLEIEIPMNEYRIEHDIIPRDREDWREVALNHKASALYSLEYNQPMSQEDYEKDDYLKREYPTYPDYVEAMEKEIKKSTEQLIKADRSITSLQPDMMYVQDGTRGKVAGFLWYSLVVAVFGVIIGGGLIAREFQDGTIRLLLIRPKTRIKLVLSKLLSLLLVCLVLYASATVLNLLTNGIMYGFDDLAYPNYTVSSGDAGVSFFAYIVPRMLMCSVVIFFAVAAAYFLSIATRSTALSVAIPLICFVGSMIGLQVIGYSEKFKWIFYTPIPYINMPSLLAERMYNPMGIEPNYPLGITMLIGLALAAIVVGTQIFRRRDITN